MFAELPLNVREMQKCAKSGFNLKLAFCSGKFGKRFFLKKFKLRLLVFGKLRLSLFSYVEVVVGLEWSLTVASLLVCLFFDILCLLGHKSMLFNLLIIFHAY
jgi:hypothetical protein